MLDAVTIVGALIALAVIAAWITHEVWAATARRRLERGLCSRCGQREPSPSSPLGPTPSMCVECRQNTQQTYHLASWFFFLLAALLAVLAPREITADYRTFGGNAAVQDFALFAIIIGLTAGAGFAIRYFGRKVA